MAFCESLLLLAPVLCGFPLSAVFARWACRQSAREWHVLIYCFGSHSLGAKYCRMVAISHRSARIEVIASVKEQLDIIISDLRASISHEPTEDANRGGGESLSSRATDTRHGRDAMASRKPRYAVIGTGMMGREHIRAVLQLNQAYIVGILDEDPDSIRRALREFSQSGHEAPTVYPDLSALTAMSVSRPF